MTSTSLPYPKFSHAHSQSLLSYRNIHQSSAWTFVIIDPLPAPTQSIPTNTLATRVNRRLATQRSEIHVWKLSCMMLLKARESVLGCNLCLEDLLLPFISDLSSSRAVFISSNFFDVMLSFGLVTHKIALNLQPCFIDLHIGLWLFLLIVPSEVSLFMDFQFFLFIELLFSL